MHTDLGQCMVMQQESRACTLPQEHNWPASSSESVKPDMSAHLFMSTNPVMALAASCAAMAAVGGLTTLQRSYLSQTSLDSRGSLSAYHR